MSALARGTWMPALAAHERIELPSDIASPARARGVARDRFCPLLERRRQNDLLVLVTELVTNAVRHAAPSDVVVHLAAAERIVRVEVLDDGPGFEPVEREPVDNGGFGLVLLRSLADSWGIDTADGTCVWFELSR